MKKVFLFFFFYELYLIKDNGFFFLQLGKGSHTEVTLETVYCFLTGSFHVPINWREHQLKVIFRHPKARKEMEGIHPQVKTCPVFAELIFPIARDEKTLAELWNQAVASVRFGFTRF